MSHNRVWIILISLLFLALSTRFFIIPAVSSGVFLSPDETAVAESARRFGASGSMLIQDQILNQFPWLHPRSYVSISGGMVPVGFLGLPLFLGILWRIFGELALVFSIPLLALSTVFPLWRLLKGLSRNSRILAVFLWLTFPTIILYANRGLFPNLPAVCLILWSLYLLKFHKHPAFFGLAGLLSGMAVAIRPVEVFWMLPWLIYFLITDKRWTEKKIIYRTIVFAAFLILPLVLTACVAWKTYGSPFAVGYWLRDPVAAVDGGSVAKSAVSLFPFGLHPRNVWFNVKTYMLGFVGLWTAFSLLGLVTWLKRPKNIGIVALGAWTVISVILFYGESIYQDHVGFNVPSFGNSFLRYTLPLVPLMILGISYFWDQLEKKYARAKTGYALMIFISLFAFLGLWTAGGRDDENIFESAAELARYQEIKATSLGIGKNAIVLSDRSDKIFFPEYLAASPMPSKDRILKLVQGAGYPVLYFGTSASPDEILDWNKQGLGLVPIFRTENQTMYKIVEFAMSIKQ